MMCIFMLQQLLLVMEGSDYRYEETTAVLYYRAFVLGTVYPPVLKTRLLCLCFLEVYHPSIHLAFRFHFYCQQTLRSNHALLLLLSCIFIPSD